MDLDQPWKIAALVGLLLVLRILWGVWRQAPMRPFMVELLDSGLDRVRAGVSVDPAVRGAVVLHSLGLHGADAHGSAEG